MGKPFLKRLTAIFLLMVCALLGIYLALPLWLPSFVQTQLAQGWQLESLEFDYPAGFVLHVDSIVLSGNPDGFEVRVAARDLDLNIHQSALDVTTMDVDIAFTDPDTETAFFALDDLAVPIIFRPGKLPRISIGSIRLILQSDGMIGNTWLFTDLQLERNQLTESWLKTRLPLPEAGGLTGQVEIRILQGALEAQLQLHLPDHDKVLQLDFRQWGEGKNISSEVSGQGRLQDLKPLLPAAFPTMGWLDRLKNIQGLVTFEGRFTGRDVQILDRASLSAQNVFIDLENESLGLDVKLEIQREEGGILIKFPAPGKFRFSDHANRISGLLEQLLPVTQNKANWAEGVNDSLLLAIEPHSEIRLQTGARPAGEFSGAVGAEFSSALLDLSFDLAPGARIQVAELLDPQSLSGSGSVNIKLESRQALTFETTASPAMPLGASLRAAGWLELDGHTIRFTESTEFQAFIPRLTANFDAQNAATENTTTGNTAIGLDFHDLEFSGAAELSLPLTSNEKAVEFHYNGSAQSKSARISQSEPGRAPQTIIDSETISSQLDFSMSGEQLRSSGSLTLHNGRMDSSALSASQVDFEWRNVDPLGVSGEFRTLTRGLIFSREEEVYQGVDLDVGYTISSNGRIEGEGDLLFAGDLRTPVRFSGGLDSGDWLIDILPSQLSLRQAVRALETTTGSIPAQLESGGGTIDIEGSVNMGNAVQGKVNISGTALGFSLAESTVEGANFNISGKWNEILTGAGWFSIDRIGLAAGLNLFQTRFSVGLMTPDTIELDDLEAEFFGGKLSADHIRLSPEGLHDTQIEMTNIDLGQVLDFVDIGGLEGTGTLDVILPAGSHGSILHIVDGVFRANGSGILSYSGSMSAAPVENIGLSALENFHYSELDGTIDYNPDGSYQLMVHLAGSNPDLYDGYPISLKLNIGGMLPEAFEVLFLSGDFNKAILNRVIQEKSN